MKELKGLSYEIRRIGNLVDCCLSVTWEEYFIM
jgi:hypothetical protein